MIIESGLQTYEEKYPIWNDDRYLKVENPTTLGVDGLTDGVIEFEFNTSFESRQNVYSASNLLASNNSSSYISLAASGAIRFISFSSIGVLNFYINSLPIFEFCDGNRHSVLVIIDKIDNRIEVDGMVYNSSNLTFVSGNKNSGVFMPPDLTSLKIGYLDVIFNSNPAQGNFFKGIIYNFNIKSLDELTTVYSLTTNGSQITASSPTTLIKNTLLELPFNNSIVDESDSPVTVTAHNSPTFVANRYGVNNSALSCTGNAYVGWNNTTEIPIYTVSGWIKSNNIIDTNHLNFLITDGNNTGIYAVFGQVAVMLVRAHIRIIWRMTPSTAYGALLENVVELGVRLYIVVKFDSINNTIALIVNGKDLTSSLVQETGYTYDINEIQPLQTGTIFHGSQDNLLTRTSDCVIDDIVIRKYLISEEELKAEYLKYPA